MSIEAMVWAMNLAPVPYDKTKPSPACAAVLIGLANHADPDGRAAFPAVDTLVRYTRLSRRTVITALDRLEDEGIITACDPEVIAAKIKRADRRPNGYDLAMDRYRTDLDADELASIHRANPMLRGVVETMLAALDSDGVQPLHVVDVTRGAAGDERDATGAERGAVDAEPGAAAAPEPTKNPPGEPTPEPTPGAAGAAPKTKRGTRLPEGWLPSEDLKQWYRDHEELHIVHPVVETEKFVDYWHAQPGQRGVKLDWDGTWRNWMRNAAERARPRGAQPVVATEHRQSVDSLF